MQVKEKAKNWIEKNKGEGKLLLKLFIVGFVLGLLRGMDGSPGSLDNAIPTGFAFCIMGGMISYWYHLWRDKKGSFFSPTKYEIENMEKEGTEDKKLNRKRN